jgi:hypothetical protein
MQSLSVSNGARPAARPWRTLGTAIALAAAAAITSGIGQTAAADCPWMVLPASQDTLFSGSEPPAYDIVFDGPSRREHVFYGFTVASLDLAWQLADRRLPELQADGRRLEPRASANGLSAYQVAADTIEPHTIYLVAAKSEIAALEEIDARIEPVAPIAVSQLLIRGGGPFAGPLPPAIDGFEIAAAVVTPAGAANRTAEAAKPETVLADWQLCAYEVALR